MARTKQAVEYRELMVGAAIPTSLATATTETGGSPTVTKAADHVALTLDNTNEAQAAVLYMGDKLCFDIDDLQAVEFIVELDATPGTAVSVGIGVCSAQNDTLDSITEGAFFRLDAGSLAIKVETDDGTNNKDDVATGFTLTAATKTKLRLNFRDGIKANIGSNSTGGKSAIQCAIDNGQGQLRPVNLNGTQLDMSNYSAGLQVFAQIAKASGTATGTLKVYSVKVDHLKDI